MHEWLLDPNPAGSTDPERLPDFLFRYMGNEGLLLTVNDRTLRFNAWSAMNDPRETHRWEPPADLVSSSGLALEDVVQRVDDVLRGSSKMLSLTSDRAPVDETSRPYLFHRGWARAALWAHYAAGHAGACLVLSTDDVMDAVGDLPARDLRYTVAGRVAYVDEPLRIDLHGDITDVSSLDAAIEELLDTRWAIQRMHTTKNRDWAYEAEVRVALIHAKIEPDDLHTSLYVPLGTALRAVILGEAHPDRAATAAQVREALSKHPPDVFQIHWSAGVPGLVPL